MIESRQILYNVMQPSLDDYKAHIRITSCDQDADLRNKLEAAITTAEKQIGKIIPQSRLTCTFKFAESITLPKVPVVGVEAVYVDNLLCNDYVVTGRQVCFGASVQGGNVKVVYKAGMPQIDADLKLAILLIAARMYNNPMDSVDTLPTFSSNILRHYRTWHHYDEQ